jgi:hypothetical protein
MTDLIDCRRTACVPAARMAVFLTVLAILGSIKPTFGNRPPAKGTGNPHDVVVLHTYETGFATEVANTIPVSAAKLVPLLPDGYELVPAAAFGLGGWDEGIVVIFNFQGVGNTVDHRSLQPSTRIDLLILVTEPAVAKLAGADIPGATHFYSLAFYTDDAEFAASLRSADMPVEFVPQITYDRQIDVAGVGTLTVGVPSKDSPFYSLNTAFGHTPAGPLNGFFWYEGKKGTTVLNFEIDVTEQGQVQSLIFTEPESPLNVLLAGGGYGPGPTDPETGYESVITPSVNLLYPQGSRGRLLLIKDRRRFEAAAR